MLEEENFFFLQNSVLFPSLFSPFNSFVLPHLSIKMAADKDKMEVDGSPPAATAQAGPAATQVRWKNTKKKKKKKKRDAERQRRRRWSMASTFQMRNVAPPRFVPLAGALEEPRPRSP